MVPEEFPNPTLNADSPLPFSHFAEPTAPAVLPQEPGAGRGLRGGRQGGGAGGGPRLRALPQGQPDAAAADARVHLDGRHVQPQRGAREEGRTARQEGERAGGEGTVKTLLLY